MIFIRSLKTAAREIRQEKFGKRNSAREIGKMNRQDEFGKINWQDKLAR